MKTGDLVLFKGNGLFSAIIMALPGANYSHVGMIYNHPDHGLCIAESTSVGTTKDVITGGLVNGVQLTPFEERVADYDGEVFLKHSNHTLNDAQRSIFRSEFTRLHLTPYETDNLQLARAELDLFPWHKNEPDLSSLFCSEYCTLMLRKMSVVKSEVVCNEETPSDVGRQSSLNDGYSYGKTSQLK